VGVKSFAKTRTPPECEVAGGVSGTLIWWVYGGLYYEGSVSANAWVRLRLLTQRRARRVPGGVTAVLAGGPGRFRLRHPRAAHGSVAHRLNCGEFTNAEANGARHYSSPFLFAPFFFGLPPHGWCIRVIHLEPIGRAAYRFLLEGMNPAGLGTIAAHLNVFYLRVSREQSMISSPGRVRVMKALTRDH
jgi:hypothetical protein